MEVRVVASAGAVAGDVARVFGCWVMVCCWWIRRGGFARWGCEAGMQQFAQAVCRSLGVPGYGKHLGTERLRAAPRIPHLPPSASPSPSDGYCKQHSTHTHPHTHALRSMQAHGSAFTQHPCPNPHSYPCDPTLHSYPVAVHPRSAVARAQSGSTPRCTRT